MLNTLLIASTTQNDRGCILCANNCNIKKSQIINKDKNWYLHQVMALQGNQTLHICINESQIYIKKEAVGGRGKKL